MLDMLIGCLSLGLIMFLSISVCSSYISNLIDNLKRKKENNDYIHRLEDINFGLIIGMVGGCVYVVLLILIFVAHLLGGHL